MKKFFTTAMIGALSISMLFTGTGIAKATVSEGSSEKITDEFLKEQLLEKVRIDYPNAQYIDVSEEELQKQEKANMGTMASAQPLSYLEAYAAVSSQHPVYEYFSASQLSSVYDHGGAELYIVTTELGHGHIRNAQFDGVNLKEHMREYIDLNGDYIIDGWYIWWDASGHDSGRFTYQNTSTNFPSNTMFDAILIK